MPELNLRNIELIDNEIRNQGITFSSLAEELIDHVCCDVEKEMLNGLSFEEAYKNVKQKIGLRRLKEIQKETLYAVDVKYRKMKNTMKISGVTGTILLAFASLFKIMHWPAAGVMMTLGSLTLAFVFIPSALGTVWREPQTPKKPFLFISAFFASSFFLLGILFKIQHWPGAAIILCLAGFSTVLFFIPALLASKLKKMENKSGKRLMLFAAAGLILFITGFLFKIQHWPLAGVLLMTGLFILFAIAFPWYTQLTWKNEKDIKAEFIFLTVGSLAIILPSALVSLNLRQSYETGYFISLNQQKALFNTAAGANRSFLELYSDSANYATMQQLHNNTDELLSFINELEKKMIAESEGNPGKPAENPVPVNTSKNDPETDYRNLNRPFQTSPVRNFLMNGTASAQNLDNAMEKYRLYLTSILSDTCCRDIIEILDNSGFPPPVNTESSGISLASGLHYLALLKNKLVISESCAMKTISEQYEKSN